MSLIFTGLLCVPVGAFSFNLQNLDAIVDSLSYSEVQANLDIVEVSGGLLRVKAAIENTGDQPAENVSWRIEVSGGTLGFVNRSTAGEIERIDAGESWSIRSDPLVGLGSVTVSIFADNVERSVNGFLLLFFVKVFPELVVKLEPVATGLTAPVVLTHAGDGSGRLFVGDQTGVIYVVEDDQLLSEPFLDISDKLVELDTTYDERGFLGLVFHPDYESNGRFFVYYSTPKTGPGLNHESILAQYQVSADPNIADDASEKILFRVDQPEANHNGGQLVFGPDGYLYVGLGDGGGAGDEHGVIGNGQNINTSLGSILRIDVDSGDPYSIPADNPFVGTTGLDEIFAWGLRNPWKFSFDRLTDTLFIADVGQDEWEEINIGVLGGNFGWRIMEATHTYDPDLAEYLDIDIATLEMPIHEYSHSVGRSITGGYMYRGNESLSLYGKYVFGDWSTSFARPNGKLYYLEEIEPDVWERFGMQTTDPFNRFILSFGEDEAGELYVLSKTTLGPTGDTGDVRKIIAP